MSAPSDFRPSFPAMLGVAACAACCTVPLLLPFIVSAGFGSAVLAWVATRSEWLGLAFLSVAGLAATAVWWRTKRAASSPSTCAIDQSCGCGPSPETKTATPVTPS